MILDYYGKAKYMVDTKSVTVVEEITIGRSFIVYTFYVGDKLYAVSKKIVDNNKTWRKRAT